MLHRQYRDNVFFRRNQRSSMFSRGSSRCIVADKLRAMCIVRRAPPQFSIPQIAMFLPIIFRWTFSHFEL